MRLLPLVPLTLLGVAPVAARAEGAVLRLFHGPDDTGAMSLKALRVALDGKDLGVAFTPGTSSDTALYAGTVAPGAHRLEFEASLDRPSRVFTYMDGYHVTLRSALDIEVPASKGLAIRSRIATRGGLTAPWYGDNGMVMTLTASEGPAAPEPLPAAAVADGQPQAPPAAAATEGDHPTPAPAAAPGAVASREPAPDCTLAPVHFAFAQAALSETARRSLEGFAGCIAAGRASLVVVGHTDSRGPDEYNRRLGLSRAAAVSTFLEAHGVGSPRIVTRSSGASAPLCNEATAHCWARNRRVEVSTGQ